MSHPGHLSARANKRAVQNRAVNSPLAPTDGVDVIARPGTAFPGTLLTNRSNRVKFTCPVCKSNAWGKPSLRLRCLACAAELVADSVAP